MAGCMHECMHECVNSCMCMKSFGDVSNLTKITNHLKRMIIVDFLHLEISFGIRMLHLKKYLLYILFYQEEKCLKKVGRHNFVI